MSASTLGSCIAYYPQSLPSDRSDSFPATPSGASTSVAKPHSDKRCNGATSPFKGCLHSSAFPLTTWRSNQRAPSSFSVCNISEHHWWDTQKAFLLLDGSESLRNGPSTRRSPSFGWSEEQFLGSLRSRRWTPSGESGTQGRGVSKGISKRVCKRAIKSSGEDVSPEEEYCDRSSDQPQGACSFRRSSRPSFKDGNAYVEVPKGSDPDQSGYTIKVSKELMGVFRYVEKVKRARIKELAVTLKQTAAACLFFSCVRGIFSPLVEVFRTRPPSWGRLVLMLPAFDAFAITYLALKASEPLDKLSMLATESDKDIMGSIEKEEEHMLALAVELVKLFTRLRNVTVCTALAQFAALLHSILRLKNPKLIANVAKFIGHWITNPWC